ncbi:MAG: chemotaxis protein CheW [Deferribacteraceae bacterium]|jgi:chemotaxis signal transduction protein|nr:chemotaxis protein CheW [Deferribacteraceae bacterium]
MSELILNDTNTQTGEEGEVIQLVGMKLGEEEYSIDVLKIQEIIRTVEITIVPRSEGYVLGVMNLRGKVIPVIDLRIRFNLDKVDFDKSTRIIVVRFEKENIGFVVDEVTQVIRINKAMVEPTPPLVGAVGQEYILGICKYRERLIILLDIDRVVGEDAESALRKSFLGSKEKKIVREHVENIYAEEPVAATSSENVGKYSMADEADAISKPTITKVSGDDNDYDDVDDIDEAQEVLRDVSEQTSVPNYPDAHVKQKDLDSLMKKSPSDDETETDVVDEQPKNKNPENALSIEELIAIELNKREAETDELNKKRRTEQDNAEKKK